MRSVLIFLALFISVFIAINPARSDEAKSTKEIIGVRYLMKNVNLYPGLIIVEGVVSHIFKKEKMFALIDSEEFKECKVVTCAALTLPVKWNGLMPEVKNIVQIEGEIQDYGLGRVFWANKLKKVR